MDSLFSHAFEPETPQPAAPVTEQAQRSLSLELAPQQAAEAFVDYLHLWWPAETVLGPKQASGAHLWWDAEGFGAETEDGQFLALGESTDWSWPQGAAVSFLEGPAGGMSLVLSLAAVQGGTDLTLSGDPSLVDAVSVSFSRFMGI